MRPTSIAAMTQRMQNFATPRGVQRGLAYKPAPTDVFISPYAKCGTTWMQQIVHGLRTGGAMAFSEITQVVPWIELAHDMGIDPNAPQPASPRAFKSHLSWQDIPKGGRYIVVFRDPLDALLSHYRFLDGWWFETGSITLTDFATHYLTRSDRDDYWTHCASWWAQRHRDDVLCLCFEDMKADLPGAVTQVADFIGITDPTHRDIATQQARFEFMKTHGTQFDDHLVRQARDAACGLPPGGVATKVHRGQAGTAQTQISPEIHAAFATRWQDTMGAAFGLATYADLRAALTTA